MTIPTIKRLRISSATDLRHTINRGVAEHQRFSELKELLGEYVEDSFLNLSPKIVALLGPSRVGKSELVKAIVRSYPSRIEQGIRKIPVLLVKTPSPVNPLTLLHSVLTSLGLNPMLVKDKKRLLGTQLDLAQTKTIIFEEASHTVEDAARVIPRDTADFFKSLYEDYGVTVILVGVPKLTRLLESNEQLLWRADSPIEFLPYSSFGDEFADFCDAANALTTQFENAGIHFDLSKDAITENLYLCSGGLYGIVKKFFLELASVVAKTGITPVTESMCLNVVKTIGSAGHPKLLPFSGLPVTNSAMAVAHATVLTRSGLSPTAVPLRPVSVVPTPPIIHVPAAV